ncbi:MAG: PTS sugar transporter subunit IIA [Chlamydiia bacterium]|nr:PTS sugar transporter subunit IIA [Chlamydiia bacterium]MCP5510180.1 PTS sugar transporter subunit IIA [Chlamydiales bacterium]
MDLKIRDVADLLSVSETTIRRWLAEGKIPAYRLHRQYRFSRIEIEDWVMGQRLGKHKSKGSPFIDDKRQVEELLGQQQFSFYRAVHKGGVLVDVAGDTKEDIISYTMQQIADKADFDAEVISELLLDREKLAPTALNNGIAVPHTREFLFKGPSDLITVVYPKHPVEWGALDGQPVHTLFFLFSCDDKRHLHLLSKLAHLSSNDECLKFLQTKPPAQELLAYIKKWESALRASV